MGEIKVNVGDPKAKTTHTFTISEDDAKSVVGKKLGDTIRGELIGKAGYELEITGGSDKAGFPMRRDTEGSRRRKILITKSLGNQKTEKGVRIRKTVAGNTVNDGTSQLNVKVTKYGKEALATPAEEKKEEAPAEAPEEAKSSEEKKEASEEKKPAKDEPEKEKKEETPKEEPAKEKPAEESKETPEEKKEAPKEESK